MKGLAQGEKVISVCSHQGQLVVATNRHVYRAVDIKGELFLRKLEFINDDQ